MAGSYWCVARSEPKREATAAAFLAKAGYAVYLPRIREVRRRHGRGVVTTPPLFPNYLMAQIELQWHRASKTIGVAGLIMSGDGPAKVPDSVIDEIRARERDGYVVLQEKPRFRPGDPIRVASGLLMGATGLFSGMRGPERVAVLLGLLGTAVLPAGEIEAM
jgi:transcriptional antiterminator RfaH